MSNPAGPRIIHAMRLRLTRDFLRLLPLLVPVAGGGFAVAGYAGWTFFSSEPHLSAIVGMLVLLAAAMFAEAYPVPLENFPAGHISISSVFVVGTALVYGWAPAIVVGFLTRATMEVVQRRGPLRFAYNGGLYALSAAGGSLGVLSVGHHHGSIGWLLLVVLLGQIGFCVVNLPLVAAMVSLWARQPFVPLLRNWVLWTGPSFALMASVTLMLDALWERSPILAASLIGPMVAIGLYQRSIQKTFSAMRLALTDPLTGLGNHRHFQERVEAELAQALEAGSELSVCLLDLDEFKLINDRFGHPAGDRLLTQVAEILRSCGDAYRLGGDEFALLLPGRDEEAACELAEEAVRRLASAECEHCGAVSFSAGVASAPLHASDRAELVRVADVALYSAKAGGKNRVHVYEPDSPSIVELRPLGDGRGRDARLAAAASLVGAVDARDAYVGSHSERVGDLAAAIAARMGLGAEEVELVRLAGRLHDLGKLAVPEEILRKPTTLTRAERAVLERHAEIGHRMLETLDVEPVASWVLHHHERYDGRGYPGALEGDEIPLGARILLVADAYDAMTGERSYRRSIGQAAALREIGRGVGGQFDPAVVAAFLAEVASWDDAPALRAVAG